LTNRTCINLILGYATAAKYRLRRQIGRTFPDLQPFIRNLPTVIESSDVTCSEGRFRRLSQALGLPGADTKEQMTKNVSNYGLNVPLEVLGYISAYVNKCAKDGTLADPVLAHALESLMSLLQSPTGMERVLGTPLPLAYNVAIRHITFLFSPFSYTILSDGSLFLERLVLNPHQFLMEAAAYIILGLAVFGRSIENPFGREAGHLNMEGYIRSLVLELDVLTSSPPPRLEEFIETDRNYPLRHAPGANYRHVREMSPYGT